MPFLTSFLGEGSSTQIEYRKKGTLILTSLVEDLGKSAWLVQFVTNGSTERGFAGWAAMVV